MDPTAARPDPPYVRIVADIRGRIASGALRPGDRVPSNRQIAREWGVALATATKALTALRQEGLVAAVPRVGTVVAEPEPEPETETEPAPLPSDRSGDGGRGDAEPAPARGPRRRPSDTDVTRERVVRAAMGIADHGGIASLSMRSVAAELGVPTMSLYRYVRGKEDLVFAMTDAAFREEVRSDPLPSGWRAGLERCARRMWAVYNRHPWVAEHGSLNRPLPIRGLLAHGESILRALEELDLDPVTAMHVQITVYSYVRGVAVNLEAEAREEAETGLTDEEWLETQSAAYGAIIESREFPMVSKVLGGLGDGYDFDLDQIFEFGLQPMLDGLAARLPHGHR